MISVKQEKNLHRLFTITVVVKAINGVIEFVAGMLLLFTGTVSSVLATLVHHELIEDPHDIIARLANPIFSHLSASTQLFAAFYLLAQGVIKIFLVFGLFYKKLWVYPTAMALVFLLIIYQAYRFTYTHSITLLFLMLFDALFIALIAHEYRHLRYGSQK